MDWLAGRVPGHVVEAARRLTDAGYEAYLVGGCVRDFSMGRVPGDFDLATSALPGEVMAVFDHAVPTGAKFGTVTVVVGGSDALGVSPAPTFHTIEVTTYRAEGAYEDGRHPDLVTFGVPLVDDLSRRDFTMNAMAMNPITGEVVDPFDGRADISARLIRAVGDPAIRFAEDKLRMLRAIRFASTLGFEIEASTLEAIEYLACEIRVVSVERITAELGKLLLAPVPSHGIELLRRTGLLQEILPELMAGWEMAQNRYHEHTVYYHTMKCLDAVPATPLLRWAALLHDIGKPPSKQGEHFYGHEGVGAEMTEVILMRMRLPARLTKAVTHLVRHHMIGYNSKWSDGAIRRLIGRVGRENMPDLLALHSADVAAKGSASDQGGTRCDEFQRRVELEMSAGRPTTISDLAVTGEDVSTLLGSPGPAVGRILKALLGRVLEQPEVNTREKLMGLARDLARK